MLSEANEFYIGTLLILYFVTLVGALGLNLQFGTSGIWNFGFAVSIGAGGYASSVLTLGAASESAAQEYVFGASLPFPLPWVAAFAAGAVVSVGMGAVSMRRLRGDYQAIVLLLISVIATRVIQNQKSLFNGNRGLGLIPQPLRSTVDSALAYQRLYLVLVAATGVVAVILVHRITRSPMGRVLRAVRDNPDAADAFGKSPFRSRQSAMAIGGGLGGLSGAMLAGFLTGWSPESWLILTTFVLFTGVILGGPGNVWGVVAGIVLVPIGFRELTRMLPEVGYPGLIEALSLAAVGLLLLIMLWVRPSGLVPERSVRYIRGVGRARPRPLRRVIGSIAHQLTPSRRPMSAELDA